MLKTDVLVYTGGATARMITEAEWLAAGITGQQTVTFDKSNNKRCRVGDLSEAAFRLLMESHAGEFRIIDSGPRGTAQSKKEK